MSGIGVVKQATELAVSIGVGSIVGNVLKSTLEGQKVNILKRVSVGFGALAIGSYVSDLVGKYAVDRIDEVVDQAQQVRTVYRDAKAGNI